MCSRHAELITLGLLCTVFCSQNMSLMTGLEWVNTPLILDIFTNGLSRVDSPNIYLQNFSAIVRLNTHPPVPPMTSSSLNVFMAFVTTGACFGSPTPMFLFFPLAVSLPLVRMGMLRGKETCIVCVVGSPLLGLIVRIFWLTYKHTDIIIYWWLRGKR